MLILGLLGMYFDAAVVFVTKSSLFFRLAVAILCNLGYHTQQVQVVPSFVGYCKKTFHQNRLFSQFGMDIFEVRRELNTMFPELF